MRLVTLYVFLFGVSVFAGYFDDGEDFKPPKTRAYERLVNGEGFTFEAIDVTNDLNRVKVSQKLLDQFTNNPKTLVELELELEVRTQNYDLMRVRESNLWKEVIGREDFFEEAKKDFVKLRFSTQESGELAWKPIEEMSDEAQYWEDIYEKYREKVLHAQRDLIHLRQEVDLIRSGNTLPLVESDTTENQGSHEFDIEGEGHSTGR